MFTLFRNTLAVTKLFKVESFRFSYFLLLLCTGVAIGSSVLIIQPQCSLAQPTPLPAPPPADFAPTNYVTQFAEQGDAGAFSPQSILDGTMDTLLAPLSGAFNIVHDITAAAFSAIIKPIGQLAGSLLAMLIKDVMKPLTTYLMGILQWFVLNPNIPLAIDSGGASSDNQITGGQINPVAQNQAADPTLHNLQVLCEQMRTVSLDLSLLIFIFAIWRRWMDGAFRKGDSLMGTVGRLIFTMALILTWREFYKYELMITNEMVKAIFFNTPVEFELLNSALIDALLAAIAAGGGLAVETFAPMLGSIGGLAVGGPAGFVVGGAIGEVIGFIGLVMFTLFGGILIAQMVYLLVLKAVQTALLVAQYVFADMFLVFFASPDTEQIGSTYIKSFIEVSLWTFAWLGLFKILVILLASQATWGKLLIVIGVLQIMISVPKWIGAAQISPASDFINPKMIMGHLMEASKRVGAVADIAAAGYSNHQLNGKHIKSGASESTLVSCAGQNLRANRPDSPTSGTSLNPNPSQPDGGGSSGLSTAPANGQAAPGAPPRRPTPPITTPGSAQPGTGDGISVPTPGLITPTSRSGASPAGASGTDSATTGAAGAQSSSSPSNNQQSGASGAVQLSPKRREEIESQLLSPERRNELQGQLLTNKDRKQIQNQISSLDGPSGSTPATEGAEGDSARANSTRQIALQQMLANHTNAKQLLQKDDHARNILRNNTEPTGTGAGTGNSTGTRSSAVPPGRTLSLSEVRAKLTAQGVSLNMNSGQAGETQESLNFAPDGSSPDLSSDEGSPVAEPVAQQPLVTRRPATPPPIPPEGTYARSVHSPIDQTVAPYFQDVVDGKQHIQQGTEDAIRCSRDGKTSITYAPGSSAARKAQLGMTGALIEHLFRDPGFQAAAMQSVDRSAPEGVMGALAGAGFRRNGGIGLGRFEDTELAGIRAREEIVKGALNYTTVGEQGVANPLKNYMDGVLGKYGDGSPSGGKHVQNDLAKYGFVLGAAHLASAYNPTADSQPNRAVAQGMRAGIGKYIERQFADQGIAPNGIDLDRAIHQAQSLPSSTVWAAHTVGVHDQHNGYDAVYDHPDFVDAVGAVGSDFGGKKLDYENAHSALEFHHKHGAGSWSDTQHRVQLLSSLGFNERQMQDRRIPEAIQNLEQHKLPVTRDAILRQMNDVLYVQNISEPPLQGFAQPSQGAADS
jgi:hypothetical protein